MEHVVNKQSTEIHYYRKIDDRLRHRDVIYIVENQE